MPTNPLDPFDVSPATLCRLEGDLRELLFQLISASPDASCWATAESISDRYIMRNGTSPDHVFREGWKETWKAEGMVCTAIMSHLLDDDQEAAFCKMIGAVAAYLTDRKTRRRVDQNRMKLKDALAEYLDLRGHTLPGQPNSATGTDPETTETINCSPAEAGQQEVVSDETERETGSRNKVMPKAYALGWRQILETLGLKNNNETKRSVRKLSDDHGGPIIVEGRGHRPKADKQKLIEWWNQLESSWQETEARKRDRQATVEGSGSQYKYGQKSIIVPEISGRVKERRKTKSDQG